MFCIIKMLFFYFIFVLILGVLVLRMGYNPLEETEQKW